MLFDMQENLIQPSVPELTLLCDAKLGVLSSPAACQQYNSNMTSGCGASQQMPSAGRCAAAAVAAAGNGSVDAVSTNDHLSSANTLQPLIPSSSVTQRTAKQPPPMIKTLYQPVVGTNKSGENYVSPCCHHCTAAQNVPSFGVHMPNECGGNQNGQYNMPHTADNSVEGPALAYPPASASVLLSEVPSNVQNSTSTSHSCAVNMRMSSLAAVSSAAGIPMQYQCQCSPAEHAMAVQNVQPSVALNDSQHTAEAIHSPSPYDAPSHNAQLVNSRPRQNIQHHQYSVSHVAHLVQPGRQHRAPYEAQSNGAKTGCCARNGQLTSQRPVVPVRFPSPASQQTSHAGVCRQTQQSHNVPHARNGSCLPLNVKCASPATAAQSVNQQCIGSPVAVSVMQRTEPHQLLTSVPVASQRGESPGGSKAFDFTNKPGAQLPQSVAAAVYQQSMAYDSDRYSSHGKSMSLNQSQQSDYQIDLQRLPSHSSTPAVSAPVSVRPRTVNDLLRTIPVQNIDWSIALPPDITTVDDFVESVLGHNSASADSGLQVSDSAVSSKTQSKMSPPLATGNCDSVLRDDADCVTHREEDTDQQHVNVRKCRELDVKSDLCEHPQYVQDRPKVMEKLSTHDDRPKLCSVAVNTSLCWPPVGCTPQSHYNAPCTNTVPLQNDARCLISVDDNTPQPANDSPSGVSVSQRLVVSDRDIELVSGYSPGMCDSMADVSLCTPPPPVFPNPSEESVLSEMIMDMPEYTALSHEK